VEGPLVDNQLVRLDIHSTDCLDHNEEFVPTNKDTAINDDSNNSNDSNQHSTISNKDTISSNDILADGVSMLMLMNGMTSRQPQSSIAFIVAPLHASIHTQPSS